MPKTLGVGANKVSFVGVCPSWIKYAQVGIIIFIALIFAFLFYFV